MQKISHLSMKFSHDLRYEKQGLVILRGIGELDLEFKREFYSNAISLAERNPRAVGYCLNGVTFMNSKGFDAILMAHRNLEARGIADYLTSPASPKVIEIFSRLGGQRAIPYKPITKILKELDQK